MKKNIILLSAKRTGSTAVMKIFQKHNKVKLMHIDQKISNWESNFWLLALDAINGKKDSFEVRLKNAAPFIKLQEKYDKKKIFEIYNEINNFFGPITFDKSPQYLGNINCLKLIQEYNSVHNNIVFLGLIRNPLDSIVSQYQLWREYKENDSLQEREKRWLKKYNHLAEIKKEIKNLKIIRYEDLVKNPKKVTTEIFNYCDIEYDENCINHLKEKSIGRYQTFALIDENMKWKWSEEFNEHLIEYNYHPENLKKISFLKKLQIIISSFKRYIPLKLKNFLRNK
jgi:hypothetical protein|tara:strand:+ start:984 stop:1832 length:849 start_codon:yes stop_codon:yes gene_type:complete